MSPPTEDFGPPCRPQEADSYHADRADAPAPWVRAALTGGRRSERLTGVRPLVVTGTDTEVGKTVVTAALAALARARGLRAAVVKPAQTGLGPGESGDVDEVRRLSGVSDVHELTRLGDPLAPATAARRAGAPLPTVDQMAKQIAALPDRDLVLVEGAGGLLVRLDAAGGTVADLAARLGAEVIVVARSGLGTLNHTALTCEALALRGLRCAGIIIGAWPAEPDLASRCNRDDLPAYAGAGLLGAMPENAAALPPAGFLKAAEEGLAAAGELIEALMRDGRSGGRTARSGGRTGRSDVPEAEPDEVIA
jgi:dethiobiotin synthetase